MTEGLIKREFQDKVLMINRISKKVKGGDKIGFSSLVGVGNGAGKIGIGYGKARDLRTAIEKGKRKAKASVFSTPLAETTVPRRIDVKEGAAKIIIKPAPRGFGLIAGGVVRDILELAGYKDASAKILGSRNKMSNAKATITALRKFADEAK
jgi:small subunit ribosomal protein S5